MTCLAAALAGIRTEIAAAIISVAPNRVIEPRYGRFREHARRPGAAEEDLAPSPRAFEVGDPIQGEVRYHGKDTHIQEYVIPVVIAYPNDSDWSIAAIDDLLHIRRHLFATHGSHGVSGIGYRCWYDNEQPTITLHGAEPINFYTFPVTVVTETTET